MDDFALFESPKHLLDATEESINNFEHGAAAFLQTCTHTIVRRVDNKAGQQVFSYRFQQRIPPRLRVLASHIIADIKHVLDQATCDAVILTGRPNAKGVHFPLGATPIDLDGEIKRRLRDTNLELVGFIRAFDTHDAGNTRLYRFLRLAGEAKHTRLIGVTLSDDGNRIHVDPTKPIYIPGPSLLGGSNWNELRNELDFLRIPIGTEYNANFSPVIEVILHKGEPPLSGSATTIFRDMAREAQRIIVGLEAEARRIVQVATPLPKG